MASNDPSPSQLALLRRGKQHVATQIKNEFARSACGHQHLDDILNHFLDINKPFDFEAADWLRYLISGGSPFPDYVERGISQLYFISICYKI